ncbi:hypothetical protein D3C75_1227750 [compost metagenome]
MIAVNRAVQLEDGAAAGLLMETIDILGDDRLQPALALQLRKQPVGTVRYGLRVEHFTGIEIKKNVRRGHKKTAAQHHLRRIR